MFKDLDGTGRPPRESQREILDWLSDNWHRSNQFAISGPTGLGKSYLARAIQKATGAVIVPPSNVLLDQYMETYPEVNFVKGKKHYTCAQFGVSCEESDELGLSESCERCPYVDCKASAVEGEDSIFNPMSLYYMLTAYKSFKPKVVIIDEAHLLEGFMLMLCESKFRSDEYQLPSKSANEIYLVKWLYEQADKLRKLKTQYLAIQDYAKVVKISALIVKIAEQADALAAEPHKFAIFWTKHRAKGKMYEYLNIKAIVPPEAIRRKFIRPDTKTILLSGTLLTTDVLTLFGATPHMAFNPPSPIPKDRRPVHYINSGVNLKDPSDLPKLVAKIEEHIKAEGSPNTIIHVPYSLSTKLQPLFSIPILFNTKANKDKIIDKFKKQGGVFLAAGCAEGLDLPGDQCRLNIIPKCPFPDLGDPAVQKRKSLSDGQLWYNLSTIKTLIQQAGRTTRSVTDYSKTIIMDKNFTWLMSNNMQHVPKYFSEAIIWRQTSA